MKTMFLAAAAGLLMLGGAALAQQVGAPHFQNEAPAGAAKARTNRPTFDITPQKANPRGIPPHELRPDGLLSNGLLPAHRWQA